MATYNVTQPSATGPRPAEERSIGELFGDLTRETTQLVRQEINLAKTEMSVKATKVGKDIGLIAAGGVLAYTGLLALVAFLILALIQAGLTPWVSALLVGVVLAGIGGALAVSGLNKLKKVDPVPHQTMEALSGGSSH
ncbi:MAG: phage holin family protein [Cytophagales bacterium]|nr:phage holin family protein [Armatimonadota bacterium]